MAIDRKLIAYYVTTAIVALVMLGGGVLDVALGDQAIEILTRLGYPLYFGRLLGVAKILGAIVILAPGLKRTKEWAYAGFAIDLVAASVSHAAVDDAAKDIAIPIAILVIVVASWALRPLSRRLEGPLL